MPNGHDGDESFSLPVSMRRMMFPSRAQGCVGRGRSGMSESAHFDLAISITSDLYSRGSMVVLMVRGKKADGAATREAKLRRPGLSDLRCADPPPAAFSRVGETLSRSGEVPNCGRRGRKSTTKPGGRRVVAVENGEISQPAPESKKVSKSGQPRRRLALGVGSRRRRWRLGCCTR